MVAEGDTVSVTYAEEGVYAVSMKAENESGSSKASAVNKPTQGSDSAARIYEVEVFGLEDTLE